MSLLRSAKRACYRLSQRTVMNFVEWNRKEIEV